MPNTNTVHLRLMPNISRAGPYGSSLACNLEFPCSLSKRKLFFSEIFVAKDGAFKHVARLFRGINIFNLTLANNRSFMFTVKFSPRRQKHNFRLVYLVYHDSDGHFQTQKPEDDCSAASACRRIDLAATIVQCYFAQSLRDAGFPGKSLDFPEKCSVFQSALTLKEAWAMTGQELWSAHARELLEAGLGRDNTKVLAFTSATR